jgi:hypothetical protein
MMPEDPGQAHRVRPLDRDLPIEASGSLHGGIDVLGVVRGRDDDHARALLDTGEQLEEQVYDLGPVLDMFAADLRADPRSRRVRR